MNEILKYFVKSLASSTLSLKKKGLLVEKPWALIDDDGEIQKLIFKRDKGLILSKNGKVMEGTWDYFPEANALLIDRVMDKLLLKEQFIDENVLILKKDGTDHEFFALANENTIPDYNIPKYLNSLKCTKLKILERKLLNGNIIQIHDGADISYLNEYNGRYVEATSSNYDSIELPDGNYMSKDNRLTFYIKDGRISDVKKNVIRELTDGTSIEIEDGNFEFIYDNRHNNINKKASINGNPISDSRLYDKDRIIYEIKDSTIVEIYFLREYELKDGSKIIIEQKNCSKISKWDKIIESKPLSPLPIGKYKIKGKWKSIKVVNNTIM